MIRQLICRGVILGALVGGSTGCETLHSSVRHDDAKDDSDKDDPAKPKSVSSDASKLNSVDSDDKNSEPFFSRNRATDRPLATSVPRRSRSKRIWACLDHSEIGIASSLEPSFSA